MHGMADRAPILFNELDMRAGDGAGVEAQIIFLHLIDDPGNANQRKYDANGENGQTTAVDTQRGFGDTGSMP